MSAVAHQYQEDFERLKQEYQEIENRMPPTNTWYGIKGDWAQGSDADLKEMIAINREQIRVAECILEERKREANENPRRNDYGHRNAIAQWERTLAALKGNKHLMVNTRNPTRKPGTITEEDPEDSDVSPGSIPWIQFESNTGASNERDAAEEAQRYPEKAEEYAKEDEEYAEESGEESGGDYTGAIPEAEESE